ncbi:MAG: hypothetical protein HN742_04780 [Lentisphaerae bacterium]|jgi:hypothetical protein|nr:hypothetical protein [Lentisphaerota bacterium]MBT4817765.1 hypothetical protein [Lentisphaerota bacterium]MBT5610868.1 hypothetical protein [Lentisphaerota bacterium]MBT7053700.1 hypothetical protein [Lentisphaerota bacterium]MBT7841161.1 hypothetical protein [Lentisphaerota bacterium]
MTILKKLGTCAAIATLIGTAHVQGAEAGGSRSKHGKKAIGKPQTTCPVMGGKINKKLYADVNGKRIYVCCAGCIAPIKKAPEAFIKKLEAKGVVLDKTPGEHAGHKHDGDKKHGEHEKHGEHKGHDAHKGHRH